MSEAIGFPTFAPGRRSRKGLAWWAIAWIDAMEQAALEPGRLTRGRTYANTGRVGPISIGAGLITALVHGNRPRPYRTRLSLQVLDEQQWEAFLDEVGSHAGRMAALLDGDMPHDLVDAAAAAGVPLLPGPGDLDPDCSCPDWGHPCKHAAALAYQAGWLLGAQPFVLLLMRGRGEDRLRAELAERNARHAGADPGSESDAPPPGVVARQAYRAAPTVLPEPPPMPTGAPPALVVPPGEGVDGELLAMLVMVAAGRSRDLASGAELTEREDQVRLASLVFATPWFDGLAAADPTLPAAVEAWRLGGADALAALEQPWQPPRADLARARTAVEQAWGDDPLPAIRVSRNRWTVTVPGEGPRQLRCSPGGRWYPFHKRSGRWWPAGAPDTDVAAALAELLLPERDWLRPTTACRHGGPGRGGAVTDVIVAPDRDG